MSPSSGSAELVPHPNPPTRLLVVLHGWGADANDLVPIASMLNLPEYQCIFPNAPFSHPQVPGGRAWYALETSNYQGLSESRQILSDWLLSLEEATKIPLEKTILCGFSQGGAMVLDVGLSLPVAALCSLSGYLHSRPEITSSSPPVLMVHGRQDMVIPIQIAQQAKEELKALGIKVDYQEFNMGHEIPDVVLDVLEKFIQDHS
ncbi:alpha/beta hydrolase [Gloeothece verrucosa]|uniref:alpha/beta hydrolase n=1 Tax=Gloeothece verrucosa TaxID=2546359 RepID=UPI001FDEC89A|nr:alpha/beta hydrolase [Gloeothece verrucosa]